MHQIPVIETVSAFMKSRVIITAAELDLFTALDGKQMTSRELALMLKLNRKALTRILDALVAIGLLGKEKDVYILSGEAGRLSATHKDSVLPMVMHMSRLWRNWSRLTDVAKPGRPLNHDAAPFISNHEQRAFIGAMHVVGKALSLDIANEYDLTPFRKMLDIGGASGTYSIAFLRKNPDLRAVIFDLENVIPMAIDRMRSEGLLDRTEFISGNFYNDDLPGGCDLALVSAVIHQNSAKENFELFKKVYTALDPGGIILIRDHIMDRTRTKPPAGALFAINMLVNTAGGNTYTFNEVRSALVKSGFRDVSLVRRGERMDCLVEARKPAA